MKFPQFKKKEIPYPDLNEIFTKVCYWETPYKEGREKEIQFQIVLGWANTIEGQACVKLLQNGKKLIGYMGFSTCPLCRKHLGTYDLVYGPYIFPEQWEHYIIDHSVRPKNSDFIKYAVEEFSK